MKKSIMLAAAFGLALGTTGAMADEDDGAPIINHPALSPEMAQKLVNLTMKACREAGFQVTVAVVDRGGNVQSLLRDRYAGEFTVPIAIDKARTSANWRISSKDFMEETQAGKPQSGVRDQDGVMAVAGGLPIEAGGRTVGGVGVSGAPGGDADEDCARKALEEIMFDLEM